MIASINLSHSFAETIGVVVLGDVIYWMVLRWFSLQAKKLAVAERLERIAARVKQRKLLADQDDEENSETIEVPLEEDESLDLETTVIRPAVWCDL